LLMSLSLPIQIPAAWVTVEEFVLSLLPFAVVGVCPSRAVVDIAATRSAIFAVAHAVIVPVVGLARIGAARSRRSR
jgi:hypothetical protein